MLSAGAYKLDDPRDQARAIQDILDAHNRTMDQSSGLLSLPVAAYGVATPFITASNRTNQDPIAVIRHGLGYEPLFIGFQGTMAAGGINELPVVDAFYDQFGTGDFNFVGQVTSYVDKTNLYVIWNDQLQTAIQSITYIIFAVPLFGN